VDVTLMVLVDPQAVAQEQLPPFCQAVAQGGATVIQLRGKSSTARELADYGRALKAEVHRHGMALVVNDRLDVALAIGADGVHVGQEDLAVQDVRRLASGLWVGLSVSDVLEIPRDPANWPDYFGVGPVFVTASKPDAGLPLGVSGLRAIAQRARTIAPVVAIGGIGPDNVASVWDAGVDGVAVISAVIHARDREKACRALVQSRHRP
jgi:thiamine-phosphate pyrophosphorylase